MTPPTDNTDTDDSTGPDSEDEEDIQDEEWIVNVFLSLREGDDVYLNHREQPFTVTNREWDDHESGYWRYTLSGYGPEYEGLVQPPGDSENDDGEVATFKTDAGTELLPKHATRDPDSEIFIVSDTNASEWLNEAGIDVR